MRVNFVFTCFSTGRQALRSGVTIVMLAIFFIATSFKKHPNRDLWAKEVNVIIRQIGHRLLLQAGDSTSRVLPVTEVKEGTFQLQFENEFVFNHDSLMALSEGLLPKKQFPSGYTVTVHDCVNASIVYGFRLYNSSPDIMPCRGRSQPAGCYIIEFAFSDLYENREQENREHETSKLEDTKRNSAPLENIEHKSIELESIEQRKAAIEHLVQEVKPVQADPQNANPKPEEFKSTTFDHSLINMVWSGMLVLSSLALLIGRFGKISKPAFKQTQDQPLINESVPELPSLGKFLFDVNHKRLLIESEVISLTDKECKILELLNKSFGELILRETLIQEIWFNEGVITGRSLDMFVSKLRKKLSSDPQLRITNVHGKGYTLEIARM